MGDNWLVGGSRVLVLGRVEESACEVGSTSGEGSGGNGGVGVWPGGAAGPRQRGGESRESITGGKLRLVLLRERLADESMTGLGELYRELASE
jgi:hypothetical protein